MDLVVAEYDVRRSRRHGARIRPDSAAPDCDQPSAPDHSLHTPDHTRLREGAPDSLTQPHAHTPTPVHVTGSGKSRESPANPRAPAGSRCHTRRRAFGVAPVEQTVPAGRLSPPSASLFARRCRPRCCRSSLGRTAAGDRGRSGRAAVEAAERGSRRAPPARGRHRASGGWPPNGVRCRLPGNRQSPLRPPSPPRRPVRPQG